MEVQPQLVLLEKTLLAIEGLGRELFPTLDLWTTAKPVLEEWMRERTSPAAHVRRLARDWPKISEDLLLLPDVLHALLRDVRRGRPAPARASGPGRGRRGVARALAGLGFLLAGVLWHGLGAAPDWLGWVGIGLGALLLAAASLV